jgi:eukaryotic-like serine/threonine-protein kinase
MPSACDTVLAHRYRLEKRIAVGGYGEVWRGTDVMLNRPVAVKLLLAGHAQHPETLARFRAEALHAAAVAHGNIARIYDYAETDPPYLVMEFVDGPSLAGLLAGGPMDPAKAMDIIAQAAAGLHAAHQAGLVHRDVKPGNLLLSQGSLVKVTDFGISYAAGSAPLTTAGTLMGTPGYIAPERINGAPASPASDLYSLGVVAYECLMGAAPFAGIALEVALAHRDRPMPPLPDSVPAEVGALVGELTAKDPAQRPASAGEVARRAARIRDTLGGGPAAEVPASAAGVPVPDPAAAEFVPPLPWQPPPWPPSPWQQPPRRPARKGRRSGWLAGAAVGVVVATLLGFVLANALAPMAASPSGRAAMMPSASPSSSSQRPVTSTEIRINPGSLVGQPVALVVSKLRQLGLNPRVQWQTSDQQPPGRVLSVRPAGQVTEGSVITVLGAVRPRPSHAAPPAPHRNPPHHHAKDGHHHHRKGPGHR